MACRVVVDGGRPSSRTPVRGRSPSSRGDDGVGQGRGHERPSTEISGVPRMGTAAAAVTETCAGETATVLPSPGTGAEKVAAAARAGAAQRMAIRTAVKNAGTM